MPLKDDILNQISYDIYGQSVINIAAKIYDYVVKGHEHILYINQGILIQNVGAEYDYDEIMLTARLLSMLRNPVLDEFYEFYYNKETIPIPSEKIKSLSTSEPFINPKTGEEIYDYKDKIFLFYRPNQKFIESLKKELNNL